jgi:tryptophan halogenase
MKEINKIVIVGGGTAGWITALNLLQKTFAEITVVSSKDIPIIGVGESTTGKLHELINVSNGHIKIDNKDLLKKTNSTYKLGIKHSNWYEKNKSFWSPLGVEIKNPNRYPHESYDLYRIYHVAKELQFEQNFLSKCMKESKLPFKYFNNFHVAYHIDTYKFGQYIKDKVLESDRVTHIEGKAENLVTNEDGSLDVIYVNGESVRGDFFIDCSGFKRLLIGNKQFKSYENELLVNRAITFNIKDKMIKNYTHARAMNNGWMWEIPLQDRRGCGYVFSDNHITPDEAKKEIDNEMGCEVEIQKDIKFNSGRIENVWFKNVLSTGLATGFIEPLEATSIHMTIIQINHFIENYYTVKMNIEGKQQEQYNKDILTIWDDIKDFIRLHYITPRQDTLFWKDVSNTKMSDTLKNKLDIWKGRMPRYADYGRHNFYDLGNTLWYQILLGMNILDKDVATDELSGFGLDNYAEECYRLTLEEDSDVFRELMSNNVFYGQQ